MEIIIGRDIQGGGLLLTVDGKDQQIATKDFVPASIGSQHCKLTINNGLMRLKNLDVNNYTYVNGQSIESKAVTMEDKIELGSDHYLIDWTLFFTYRHPPFEKGMGSLRGRELKDSD